MTTERTPTLAGYEPSSANALKPGPLDAGMVRLLTAGRSVLRVRDGEHGTAFEPGELLTVVSTLPGHIRFDRVRHGSRPYPPFRFEYVGERSDDGWITAPPGGWGSNPVPGRMVQVRFKDGETSEALDSECFGWAHHPDPLTARAYDIIAFRLVEEASPVGEGLGSSAIEADTHRATDGAVLARPTGVRLEGRMDGPNPMMRVVIERADGTEFEIIQDNGTIISHWARIP